MREVYFLKPTEETIKIAQSLFALLGATAGVFIGFLLNQAMTNF
ncbi:hypothetical protein [Polynucleobacter necessarius]|nr:hypothetical protein [Polynucleobacter necessarius]